jgi:hypothetical protein
MKAADFFDLPDGAYRKALEQMVGNCDQLVPAFSSDWRMKLALNGDALELAALELSAAAIKHEAGEFRFAFMLAVQAALTVFSSFGASPEQEEIYRHMYRALVGLDVGSISPALEAITVHNRPIDPPSAWTARACLALALECRSRLGESLDLAATMVCDDFHRAAKSRNRTTEQEKRRLQSWRSNFNKKRVPEGYHVRTFNKGMQRLEILKDFPKDEQRRVLVEAAGRFTRQASKLQSQVPNINLWE